MANFLELRYEMNKAKASIDTGIRWVSQAL